MDIFSSKDYWENRLKENFGLHGTGFIGLGIHYNNWMYKIRRRILLHKTKSLHVDFRNIDVLDVGSGTGFYIEIWKELRSKKIVGTDITNIVVEKLRQRYPAYEFHQIDIGTDDDIGKLGRQKFDVVSAFDVLFHIINDDGYEKAIKNIYSLLKHNGIFIFSDNFLHGNTIRSKHQVTRSLNVIEKTLIRNGFEIIERCPMFVLMNSPVDTTQRPIKMMWRFITKSIQYNDKFGLIIGAILYPLELMLVTFMKESPSTEMMICRKS
jgi:SAM-dependent methyltransferase